jgi:hypothetical protein
MFTIKKGEGMKLYTKILLLLIVLFNFNLFSQIPNAGFENWANGNPEGWFTSNIQGFLTVVTQSNDAHTGSSAVKMDVVEISGFNYTGYIWSGENFLEGFPVSQAYGSLTGYYKFNRAGDDEMYVVVYMKKEGNFIGFGSKIISDNASSYTQFVIPIEYTSGSTPDTSFIWVVISDSSDGEVSVGSSITLDDLAFGGSVDVEVEDYIATSFSLEQNYPNPFNPSTKINFNIPEQAYVNLTVYDILGNEITKLVSDTYPAGKYSVDFEANNLPAGVYLAKITAGNYSNTIKMMLLK